MDVCVSNSLLDIIRIKHTIMTSNKSRYHHRATAQMLPNLVVIHVAFSIPMDYFIATLSVELTAETKFPIVPEGTQPNRLPYQVFLQPTLPTG